LWRALTRAVLLWQYYNALIRASVANVRRDYGRGAIHAQSGSRGTNPRAAR
jgi:hypothetical protein